MDFSTEVVRLMRTIEAICRNGGGATWIEGQTKLLLENALKAAHTAGYEAAVDSVSGNEESGETRLEKLERHCARMEKRIIELEAREHLRGSFSSGKVGELR